MCALAFPAAAGAVVPAFNGLIAYEDEDDIALVTPGGRFVKYFHDPNASFADPAWTPDGSKFAFTSGGTLWLMNADGTGKIAFPGLPASGSHTQNYGSPTWSPDGSKLLFIDVDGDLNVVNANGTGLTELLAGTFVTAEWSPDGTKIIVTEYIASEFAVSVLNTNGTGLTKLGDGLEPGWSPDGTKIVFSRDNDLYTMNANGSGETPLVSDANSPAWSPDGTLIAFQRYESGVYVIKPDGTGRRFLTDETDGYGSVDWQPVPVSLAVNKTVVDYGKKIVFTARLAAVGTPSTAQVDLYATPFKGTKTFIGRSEVTAGGAVTISVKPAKKTKYVLQWAGDATHGAVETIPFDVKVRAAVEVALSGQYRRSGRYALFHEGKRMVLVGRVLPIHRGAELRFIVQRLKRPGRWKTTATESFRIRRSGVVAVAYVPSRTGTYRVCTEFKTDEDHLGGRSEWRFAKITG